MIQETKLKTKDDYKVLIKKVMAFMCYGFNRVCFIVSKESIIFVLVLLQNTIQFHPL